ncbi:IS66 family insertion sequence element accessory protein TnpA [Halomonas sp. AOP43-A1-21]
MADNQKRGREFWVDFFKRFARSSASLADFCKRNDVSYKTARNWSSKLNGEDTSGQGHTAGIGKGAGDDKAPKDGDWIEKESTPTPDKPASPAGGEEQGPKKRNKGWENLIPAEKGNQRALKHGAYASALPPDINEQLNTYGRENIRSLEDEIRLTKGRLIMVTRKRAEWDAREDYREITPDDYDLVEVTEKNNPMGGETIEKRVKPDFEAQEDRLTRRLAWLQQVHDQLSRRISLTADEAVALRGEILQKAEDEGWSSIDTGWEIEKHGLELPFTLQQKIRSELALIEPPEPEGGMTDEELEALSAEYEQEMADEDEWLANRQQEVEEIHAAKEAEKQGV